MNPPPFAVLEPPEFRVGIGYDCHRLVPDRPLMLGGVEIESNKGLLGHSDADVVLHAITDALLGAVGQGDIGELFPPSDPQWKDAPSSVFVRHAVELVQGYGWRVVNLDIVVVIERPRILPHRESIRENIRKLLGIDVGAVGLKAKTGEGIGPVGKGKLAESHAVVLLMRREKPKLM